MTVTNVFDGSIFDGPTNVVVGPGIELPNFGGVWDIDIGAESIDLSSTGFFTSTTVLDQYVFEDLDWITPGPGSIVGVNLTTTAGTFNIQPKAKTRLRNWATLYVIKLCNNMICSKPCLKS